ncbi:MAG: tRNA pseudouridine(38-40) synthase TruA [Spirochaetales bacterium]|nr:tRNA pseudouridine(38-40) synthase TruA [Spirochaetales bacterium]
MTKQRVALLVSYDGTDFCGWQVQNGQDSISVQGSMERALSEICGEKIGVTGSGRTDSGVHATGQVAHADIPVNIPGPKVREALNSRLPGTIRILKSRVVPDDFHSRFGAVRREYGYYISPGIIPPAHRRNYCHYTRRRYNLRELNEIASVLRGVHDFSTFAAAGDQSKSRTREIFSSSFHREGDLLVFRIAGNAFLWRMVRSLTGTLLHVADQGGGPEEMARRLAAMDRNEAGPTAPSRGLFLEKVEYGSEYGFF